MKHVLSENWAAELDDIVARARGGDSVLVPNTTAVRVGHRASRRAGKLLFFRVDPTSATKFDVPAEVWAEYPNARYSTVSAYGVGMLHSDKPAMFEEAHSWKSGDEKGRLEICEMYMPVPVIDWRESLRERPDGV